MEWISCGPLVAANMRSTSLRNYYQRRTCLFLTYASFGYSASCRCGAITEDVAGTLSLSFLLVMAPFRSTSLYEYLFS